MASGSGLSTRIRNAVPMPSSCNLACTLQVSQPVQSMMRLMLRNLVRNSSLSDI